MATYKLNEAGKLELDRSGYKHTQLYSLFIEDKLGPDSGNAWKEIRGRGINHQAFTDFVTVINEAKIPYAVGAGVVRIDLDKHVETVPTGSSSKRRRMSSAQPSLEDDIFSGASTPESVQSPIDDAAEIEQVFVNVIGEIEKLLNRHQLLRSFIADSTTRFIENQSGRWCVTEEVRTSGFRLEPVLNGIADRLDDFGGDSQDWKSLGEVAGGLSVLGLDRSWVAGQIVNARTASAEYLAHDESVGIGDDRYVNLLHLVTCGLADGIARLESLYHDPPLDDHRLPDDTGIKMGTTDDDKEMQLKLFLIRSVIGRRKKIDMSTVDVQLELVRDICVDAFREDKPYYGSSPQYKGLVDVIRKNLLVEDLLLIFPSGANPKLLVADCVSVFRCLGRIFDAVQANTGMQS